MKNVGSLSLRRRLALEAERLRHNIHIKQHPLRQLFWESTRRCNVNCLHCGSDCVAAPDVPDMPAEDFLKVLDDIAPHVDPHHLMVIISGGEPLVRTDLENIGREIYRREFPWGIVTNGFALTQKRFASLCDSGLSSVAVSLDGLQPQHDWLRGRDGSHDRALQALRMLAAQDSVLYDAITCVHAGNVDTLPQIAALLQDVGVTSWRLFTIFPAGRAAANPTLRLNGTQYRRLMEFIVAMRRESPMQVQYCCEGFLGKYEGKVRDAFFRCEAGVSVASVLIDGSISGCASIRSDYAQGNIYRDDFWQVWTERFEAYRDREWMHTGGCEDCRMWRYCRGNGMHLRRSDGSLARCNLHDLAQ